MFHINNKCYFYTQIKSLTYLRTKYQYEKHEKEFNFNGNCRIDDFILQ